MKNVSTKKLFLYISLCVVLCYFLFVIFAYNGEFLPGLYTLEQCNFYYMIAYVLLVATAYMVDTSTRKEPAYLTLFCVPAFSLLFLLGIMFLANVAWHFIVVLLLSIVLLYILGYFVYQKWIEKILMIKNGYENILLGYVIIHLFIVLLFAFKIVGLL